MTNSPAAQSSPRRSLLATVAMIAFVATAFLIPAARHVAVLVWHGVGVVFTHPAFVIGLLVVGVLGGAVAGIKTRSVGYGGLAVFAWALAFACSLTLMLMHIN